MSRNHSPSETSVAEREPPGSVSVSDPSLVAAGGRRSPSPVPSTTSGESQEEMAVITLQPTFQAFYETYTSSILEPPQRWADLVRVLDTIQVDEDRVPHPSYQDLGWRLCSSVRTSVYFHNVARRVVTDFDLRKDDVLDSVSKTVDEQGSASLPPEGWELWIRAPDQGATPILTWVNHDLRCVARSRPDGNFPAVSERGGAIKLETAVEDWDFVESHRSHRDDALAPPSFWRFLMGRPPVEYVAFLLSLLAIFVVLRSK